MSPRVESDWTCVGCGGTGGLLIMEQAGPVCLTCAELDHLLYLPRGDAALTRHAKAGSRLSAVVVRFSRARKRYERQSILVEEAALEEAERQLLADAEARVRRRAPALGFTTPPRPRGRGGGPAVSC